MMRTLARPLSGLLTSLALAGAAAAADRPLGLVFDVGAATDYVFRGLSQTDNDPHAFADAGVALGGIGYASVWLSNVDFAGHRGLEYDFAAGVRPTVGPFGLDLGVVRYGYSDEAPGRARDFLEWRALASIPFGPASFGAGLYHTDRYFGVGGAATYYELNAAASVPRTDFSVSGAVGRQEIAHGLSYTTWNLGVGYSLTDAVGFDLRYWDTDRDALGRLGRSRVAFGVKASF
jgi:uncharacterized protein (TIGR02001 family)